MAIALAVAALGFQAPTQAQAPQTPPGPPILFSADQLTHDRELGTVTASGNVEFSRGDQILLADFVNYNQRQDIVAATGNVSIVQTNGDVLFAEYVELSGDMKNGIIRDIRVLLSDTSRIAAAGGRRSHGDRLEFRNAVYSPCRKCGSDANDTPLWQIKAIKVVHDQVGQTIEYSDAWLEFKGVPVAYTPYFSHPDPTVKRKSGFLVPSFGGDSTLGAIVRTPYYFAIAPNRDATVTPILTTQEGPVLAGEYRERQSNASLKIESSITRSAPSLNGKDKIRGHVKGDLKVDHNDYWRWGANVHRSTDDTYLSRYQFGPGGSLTSRAFVEGFGQRNYMALNAYSFQNPREGAASGESPTVLPMFDFNSVGEAGPLGARTSIDLNGLALTRIDDWDTKRVSAGGKWQLPYTAPAGDIYTLTASLRGDFYYVDDLPRGPEAEEFDGFAGRIWPQVSLDWSYPLTQDDEKINQIFEPLASFVVSPYGGNPDKIPNEDSIDFEFDENNLFGLSRFTGIDRVDGGPRINYGFKWGLFGETGSATALVGQSYRLKADSTYKKGSGLENNLSDVVGRIQVKPNEQLDLIYKTRIDQDNFSPRRNELGLSMGPPALRLSTNYLFFGPQEGTELSTREELSGSISAKLDRFWRSSISAVRDLADNGGMRSVGMNLIYECDCFVFDISFSRRYFQNQDVEPSDTIFLRLTFKTLGDVQTGLTRASGG